MTMNALETLVGELRLTELAKRSGKSLEEIVAFAMGETQISKTPPQLAPVLAIQETPAVNTRTPQGRAAYDHAILKFLLEHKDWTSAGEIRAAVGGSALQARTALNRMCETGDVEYQGQARATKYRAK